MEKKRNFILIQLPEIYDENHIAYKEGFKNICELAEERLKRSGKFIKENSTNNSDLGFKVFKIESSNLKIWNSDDFNIDNANEYFYEHMDPFVEGRTNEDLLYEIILKEGLLLSVDVIEKDLEDKKIYLVDSGKMVICLDNEIDIELVKKIGELKPETIIFKDSGFVDENSKINALQELKRFGIEELKIKSI